MKETFYLFIKGIIMGVADLVPGISGGTIAFITGIYERLINAITSFNKENLKELLTGFWKVDVIKNFMQKTDFVFLVVLGLGIVTAILSGSHLMSFLFEYYTIYVLAFFVGLILASCKIIFSQIDDHNNTNHYFGLSGMVFGVLLFLLAPSTVTSPSLFYIFFGGLIAVAALFLPGVSGSFILLVLGLYEYVINAVKSFYTNLETLLVFILGAIIGAVTISRVIRYFFKKFKSKTLYFLLGIVIGSVSIPLDMIATRAGEPNAVMVLSLLILFVAGIVAALGIEQLQTT